jgi:hypothetical protein
MQALEAGVVATLQQEKAKVAQLVELNDQLKQAFRDYAKRSATPQICTMNNTKLVVLDAR